jgi:hypothetical protein
VFFVTLAVFRGRFSVRLSRAFRSHWSARVDGFGPAVRRLAVIVLRLLGHG